MSIRILIVCLGNICRSPTAEAVLAGRIAARGLSQSIEVDSAGTAAYHVGNPPDPRSQAAAANRYYDLSSLRARQLNVQDFENFDYILAADNQNLADILALQKQAISEGVENRAIVNLFLEPLNETITQVPDPYYGGDNGFEEVLDLCEKASDLWLDKLT